MLFGLRGNDQVLWNGIKDIKTREAGLNALGLKDLGGEWLLAGKNVGRGVLQGCLILIVADQL